MPDPPGPKPVGAVWRQVADLPPEAATWGLSSYREVVARWRDARTRFADGKVDHTLMDIRLRERRRGFAVETGQIEGLYHLRYGVAEQLLTEGFEGARGSDSLIGGLSDETLRGLLKDQMETLETVLGWAKAGKPLSHQAFKTLHRTLVRHQDTAVGIEGLTGRRIQIPLRKGDYKVRPNNPRRLDGFVHEYCPPEQVRSELDRLLEFHRGHEDMNLPTEVEAAWLHHEFVRVHPFQDGNGRMSRLLMAYVFARNGEFPPVLSAVGKRGYIAMLEIADDGDLRPFVRYLGDHAMLALEGEVFFVDRVLAGHNWVRHSNGGTTSNGTYYPPEPVID